MRATPLVLVVDDDPHVREVVCFALGKAGMATCEAATGKEALGRAARETPDLMVLDILMPEMDGTEVCRAVRARSALPIVFLTSRDEEVDRIVGLELGGDDYVTKPFSPRELVARVRAVLRRSQPHAADRTGEVLCHGKLVLDVDRFEARWDGKPVVLTATEFGILRALLGWPGKVFTREELMERVYPDERIVADRTMDSHVRRVRAKIADLGGDSIETVHGVGYKISDCA